MVSKELLLGAALRPDQGDVNIKCKGNDKVKMEY